MNERIPKKTIIYVVSSVLLCALGVILLLKFPQPSDLLYVVGVSLLVAGITNLGMAVVRAVDDWDGQSNDKQIGALQDTLTQSVGALSDTISESTLALGHTLRSTPPSNRCASDVDIGRRFRAEFTMRRAAAGNGAVVVSLIGLKLRRFFRDQLDWMKAQKGKSVVRALLQDPDCGAFEQTCAFEGKGVAATLSDICRTLELFQGGEMRDGAWQFVQGSLIVQIRFTSDYQPITMFGVDDVVYVRPRIKTPGGASTRFYESYDRNDEEYARVHRAHFDECWEAASFVIPKALETGLRGPFQGAPRRGG